jgi:hypothetical protein
MFIGHFAVGFGSKRFAPSTSLATLIAAPIFLDLLWPFFVLAGIEQVRIDPGNTVCGYLFWIDSIPSWRNRRLGWCCESLDS